MKCRGQGQWPVLKYEIQILCSSTLALLFSFKFSKQDTEAFPLTLITCNMKLQGIKGLTSSHPAVFKVWSTNPPGPPRPYRGVHYTLGSQNHFHTKMFPSFFTLILCVQWNFLEPMWCMVLQLNGEGAVRIWLSLIKSNIKEMQNNAIPSLNFCLENSSFSLKTIMLTLISLILLFLNELNIQNFVS